MKIIDAHIHTCFETFNELKQIIQKAKIDYSMKGLCKEMNDSGISKAVSITCNLEKKTPINLEQIKKQIEENNKLIGICGINPYKTNKKCLEKTKQAIEKGIIKGLKVYCGYYKIPPISAKYFPFYKLANKVTSSPH